MSHMISTKSCNTNGVDVEQLARTIEAVKNDREIAQFRFRVKNRWLAGGHNRSTIDTFDGACQEHGKDGRLFVFDNDEPPVLLGEDKGANPVEFILHALAGCMTTTMVYHAAARGIIIEELESELEGELDLHGFLKLSDTVRNGYQNIKVKFKVKSDASPELLAELAKGSPVFDVINNPVPVDVEVAKI